jgi:hypothetical protein
MKTKQPKRPAVSPVPAPPPWARREILKLARDSGMMTSRLYDMVIRNGLESTRSLLEEQITLIASIDAGPTEEAPPKVDEPAHEAPKPDQSLAVVNGSERPADLGASTGSDDAGFRRAEPAESNKDDFLDPLVSGQSGGIENG